MKILSNIKRLAVSGIVLGVVAGAVLAAGVLSSSSTSAAPGNSDCGNAVFCGGVSSATDAFNKYNGSSSADHAMRNVYDSASFNISESDMQGLKSNAVSGSVTKTGDIIVGGKVVATGALTAGLENISGSTKHSNNGTTYYTRPPKVSFLDPSLSAIVDMKNGVFQFALITSCGNPVVAHPKLPNYEIVKTVRVAGSGNAYSNNITVKSGTKVEYKIVVSSTGAVPVKNVTVSDNLPTNASYVNNTLKHDGNAVSADKKFFAGGLTINSLNNGDSTSFTFDAIVGNAKDTDPQCKAHDLDNEGVINAPTLPKKHNGAIVHTKCTPPPAPVFACTNLTDSQLSDLEFKFNASAKAQNGAKVTGYTFNFGDGSTKSVTTSNLTTSTDHTYAKAGTFNASVTAIFDVNGKVRKDTGSNCQVTVKPKVPAPQTLVCNKLTDVKDTRTMFTFNATATATNGATITGYSFSFGDGTSKTVASTTAAASTNHTYSAPGTYNVTVNVLGMLNGKAVTVTSATCATPVTVTPAPAAECTNLTATPGTNNEVSVTAAFTATNGAALKSISYDFGDNSAPVVSTNTTATHTYAQPGTFTIVATLSFSGAAAVPNSTCKAVVTFNAPQPIETCDAFTATMGDNRTVTVTGFSTTAANGAVFTSADINWGDNSADTSTATPIGQTHTYAADGTFTIQALAHFTVNGQDVTAGGTNCQTTVTFSTPVCTPPSTGTFPNCVTPTPPTPTTPAPTELVNTGAGNVIGLFAGASILGTLGYRWFLGRKFSQNS